MQNFVSVLNLCDNVRVKFKGFLSIKFNNFSEFLSMT